MKVSKKWGTVALSALCATSTLTGVALAQPTTNAGKGANPANTERRQDAQGGKQAGMDGKANANKGGLAMLETIVGAKFTPEQQAKIVEANTEKSEAEKSIEENYRKKVAGALGITVEELDAKEKAYREQQREQQKAERGDKNAEGKNAGAKKAVE